MDLQEIRNQIDCIDDQLVCLFLSRMRLSAEVAAYKAERGLPIYVPEREQQILDTLSAKAGPEMAENIKELYTTIFRLSREYQNRLQQK